MSRADVKRSYGFMHLTDAEIDQIIAFPFEPIRKLGLSTTFASVLVGCVCGEDTPVVVTEFKDVANCICGRDWNIKVTISASLAHDEAGTVT